MTPALPSHLERDYNGRMDVITGKILKLNGWPDGKIIGIAKDAAAQLAAQGLARESVLAQLAAVRTDPAHFLADPIMTDLARECLRLMPKAALRDTPGDLREAPLPYPVWGRE